MNNSILFIGKWDDNLQSLENQIINLQVNEKSSPIQETDIPDVKKYSLSGYNSNVWAIVGDVKPTVLLKSLISKTKIVIFVFNMSDENSLTFLKNGWGPIIEKINKSDDQERILIGTRSATSIQKVTNDQITEVKVKFSCEDLKIANEAENNENDLYPISLTDIINHIEDVLSELKIKNSLEKNDAIETKIPQKNENEIIVENSSIFYRLLIKGQTAEIIESPNAEGEIKIPTSINYEGNDYVIKKICDKAFSKSSIKALSFSEDSQIEQIGDYAFENSKLEKLFIPKYLTDLSKYWNGGADNLSIVKVDPKNTRYIEENGIIYSGIQNQNQKFKFSTFEIIFVQRNMYHYKFDVNRNFTRIGCFAFYNYRNIESFTFNNPISKMIDIGDYCLCCARDLRNIQITTEELNIGDYCFKNCSSLSSIIFYNIKNAKIGANAFDGCKSLNKFNLFTTSNIELCAYCFNETNIKTINLYCSEKLILGNFCFNKCSSLNSITFQSNSSNDNLYDRSTLYYYYYYYYQKPSEKSINDIFIGDNCFEGCTSLQVFKCENIQNIKINKNAFEDCKKLENVILSKVKTIKINEECFSDNNIIRKIVFQSDKIDLTNNLFNSCHSLKNIIIETNQDLTIPSNAFKECQNLNNITLASKSTLTISEENFLNMGYLETIKMSGNKIIIQDNCFNKCINISLNDSYQKCSSNNSLIIISKTLVEIGKNCFNELLHLNSIEITGQQIMTKNGCFNKCYSLSSLIFSNSLEIFIGKFNFMYLSKLDSISFINVYYIEISSESFTECNKISKFHINPITFEYTKFFISCVRRIDQSKSQSTQTFVVKKKETANEFIIKCFYVNFTKSFFNKLTSLMRLNNFSIQPFTGFGYMKYNSNFCPTIFRDYAKYSLFEIIQKQIELTGTQRYIILLGITFGMKYLHSFKINHSNLTLNNILIDENYYPHICDYNLSNQNDIFSYKEDVYSYSIITYILITGRKPLKNDSNENIDINLTFIKDREISKLFKRIWLFDLSFSPPFDDIYDEIKSERYQTLFDSNEKEVSKYLQLIEESEQESESKEMIENDEKEVIFESNEGIVYKLNISDCTAEIIESPKVIGDIFIPKYIEFQSKKYKIIRISQKAFYRSSIESLSFSLNSFVERIDNFAFYGSRLQKLLIPNSLKEIENKWLLGAENLLQIEVDSKNENFIKNDGALYYSNHSKPEQIEIIFISPNITGQFIIHQNVTHICCFSFSKDSKIEYIESQSKVLQINQYSFYCCNKIVQIILNQESYLLIEEKSFYGMKKLKAIVIKSPTLDLKENFIQKCPSLEMISIEQSGEFTISSSIFKGCESISKIRLKTDSILKLLPNCFSILAKLKSIEIIGKQIIIDDGWINNCTGIQTLIIEKSREFTISPNTFKGCESMSKIRLKTDSILKLLPNCFSILTNLKSIEIIGKQILIDDGWIGNYSNIQTLTITNSQDLMISQKTFYGLNSLTNIILNSNSSITIGSEAFKNCFCLKNISISSTIKIDILDKCFSGLTNIQEIKIKSEEINLGSYCFNCCYNLKSVLFENVKKSTIGSYIFNECSSLTEINIDVSSDLIICDNCFSGSCLRSVNLICDVIILGKYIIYDCLYIKSVIIQSSKNYFDDYSFLNQYGYVIKPILIDESINKH